MSVGTCDWCRRYSSRLSAHESGDLVCGGCLAAYAKAARELGDVIARKADEMTLADFVRAIPLVAPPYRCVKPSCGRPYAEQPGSCRDCGSDVVRWP